MENQKSCCFQLKWVFQGETENFQPGAFFFCFDWGLRKEEPTICYAVFFFKSCTEFYISSVNKRHIFKPSNQKKKLNNFKSRKFLDFHIFDTSPIKNRQHNSKIYAHFMFK